MQYQHLRRVRSPTILSHYPKAVHQAFLSMHAAPSMPFYIRHCPETNALTGEYCQNRIRLKYPLFVSYFTDLSLPDDNYTSVLC